MPTLRSSQNPMLVTPETSQELLFQLPSGLQTPSKVTLLKPVLSAMSTGLQRKELRLLESKQDFVKTLELDEGEQQLNHAINSTLILAQEEAGTAVCISPGGPSSDMFALHRGGRCFSRRIQRDMAHQCTRRSAESQDCGVRS